MTAHRRVNCHAARHMVIPDARSFSPHACAGKISKGHDRRDIALPPVRLAGQGRPRTQNAALTTIRSSLSAAAGPAVPPAPPHHASSLSHACGRVELCWSPGVVICTPVVSTDMTAVTAASARRFPAIPRLISTGLFLVAVAVVLCGCALAAPLPSGAIGYGSVALACYASGLLCLTGARRGELGLAQWKLGSWVLLWYAAASGIATLAWQSSQYAAEVGPSSVLRALWLTAVAVTCWAAGYAVGPGAPVRNWSARSMSWLAARRSAVVRGPLAPWALYAVATAARIATAATTGRIGYVGNVSSAVTSATGYGQVLVTLSLLGPLAVMAAALRAYREQVPGARLALAVLFLAEMAYGAVSGNKSVFVIAVVAVVIPASAARRRVPKAAVIAGTAVFLALVIPFTASYRAAARSGTVTLSASQAVDEAPGILRQDVTGSGMLAAIPASASYLLQRISNISGPAVIMQLTPSRIPWASPADLVTGPLASLVPRALWPGKPILDDGYQFSQQYYGLPSDVYTASSITPSGDLYRHGGWVPVIAGMFLLGCLVRLLDDVLDVRASPHAAFLLLLLFPVLVQGEADWVTLLAEIPVTLAAWLMAVTLAFRGVAPGTLHTLASR
jgi:hypothetical protein